MARPTKKTGCQVSVARLTKTPTQRGLRRATAIRAAEQEEDQRGLLAGAAGGVLREAVDVEQRGGDGPAGGTRAEQVAPHDVGEPDAGHREDQEERAHGQQVVDADQPPEEGADAGHEVAQGPGPVDNPFVRCHAVGDPLAGVGVEREVPAEVVAEAVQRVDDTGDQGQQRTGRVDAGAGPRQARALGLGPGESGGTGRGSRHRQRPLPGTDAGRMAGMQDSPGWLRAGRANRLGGPRVAA